MHSASVLSREFFISTVACFCHAALMRRPGLDYLNLLVNYKIAVCREMHRTAIPERPA